MVLETYAILMVLGEEVDNVPAVRGHMPAIFRRWEELLSFVRTQQDKLQSAGDGMASERVLDAAHAITRNLAELQGSHCDRLTSELVRISTPGTARVPLKAFMSLAGGAATEPMFFSEDEETLRTLGVLDESDPQDPHVIIPNYVLSPTNCLASVGLFQACCVSRCDELLAAVEDAVQSPEARPDVAAEVLLRLRGAPADAAQQMAAIAAQHGGLVPLHGHAFAQWMHQNDPGVCPQPRPATHRTVDEEDWEDFTGEGWAAAGVVDLSSSSDLAAEAQAEPEEVSNPDVVAGSQSELQARQAPAEPPSSDGVPKDGTEEKVSKRNMGWMPILCMVAAAAAMVLNLGRTMGALKTGLGDDEEKEKDS